MMHTAAYRFDGSNCRNREGGLPSHIRDFFERIKPPEEKMLSGTGYFLDQWDRGVLHLTPEQAAELGQLVAEWNEPGEGETCHAFWTEFREATGAEHLVPVASPRGEVPNQHWQW